MFYLCLDEYGMHFFLPHIYLLSLSLIARRQLPNCALYDRVAKENISKISINYKHAFSTIFSTVKELLQSVYREKTELQVVTNHSVRHR